MPKIVGLITKFETGSAITESGAAGSRPATTLHFFGGGSARIAAEHLQSPAYTKLLDELRLESLPVYAEVDEASVVTRLLIPLVVRVRGWEQLDSGDVTVDLQPSHAVHVLRKARPDFNTLFDAVKRAREDQHLVAVTETPRHPEIIDVTPTAVPLFDWDRNLVVSAHLALHTDVPPALRASVTTLTREKAHALFTELRDLHCHFNAIEAPCIPFAYPDDGCHARAHRMCEILLQEHQVHAGKIWLFGDPFPKPATLKPHTPNNPDCKVLWRYHVAPFIQVGDAGGAELQVIDPALFSHLVPKEKWKEVQRDPHARFDFTAASIYDRPESGKVYHDADFSATPRDLAHYRHLLRQQITEHGTPPYC